MKRSDLAIKAMAVGDALNALRLELFTVNYFFLAGAVRVLEEGMLFVYNTLSDDKIPDGEL